MGLAVSAGLVDDGADRRRAAVIALTAASGEVSRLTVWIGEIDGQTIIATLHAADEWFAEQLMPQVEEALGTLVRRFRTRTLPSRFAARDHGVARSPAGY